MVNNIYTKCNFTYLYNFGLSLVYDFPEQAAVHLSTKGGSNERDFWFLHINT